MFPLLGYVKAGSMFSFQSSKTKKKSTDNYKAGGERYMSWKWKRRMILETPWAISPKISDPDHPTKIYINMSTEIMEGMLRDATLSTLLMGNWPQMPMHDTKHIPIRQAAGGQRQVPPGPLYHDREPGLGPTSFRSCSCNTEKSRHACKPGKEREAQVIWWRGGRGLGLLTTSARDRRWRFGFRFGGWR